MPAKPFPVKRLSALLLLCACASDACAQSTPGYLPLFDKGMVCVGLQFGPSRPTSTHGFNKTVSGGIGLDLQSFYYPSDWIAIGVLLDYISFGSKKWESYAVDLGASPSGPGLVEMQSSSKGMAFALLTRLNLLQERSWTPYIVGGIGRHTLSTSASAATQGYTFCDDSGSCGSSKSGGSKGTMLIGGAGVEFFVIRGLSLSGEVRFRQFRIEGGDALGRPSVESLSYLIGITTWFNYKR
ncbi:MAG: outer membrane beta-barrel protein [Elusimicrobia bacterium]|nr:outer membrane beta-barrel protein [Elusimicrobiota bacterium]